jgi:hypothetical protein
MYIDSSTFPFIHFSFRQRSQNKEFDQKSVYGQNYHSTITSRCNFHNHQMDSKCPHNRHLRKVVLLLNIVGSIAVRAATDWCFGPTGSTRVDAPIGVQNAEAVASASTEPVSDLIERENAAIIGTRVDAVGSKVHVIARALAIHPNGMIFVPIVVICDTVVEVAGEGTFGHESTNEGSVDGGEMHYAIGIGIRS